MGEAVLKDMVSKAPYQGRFSEVDSCGTASYHIGDSPDSRAMRCLRGHGITNYVHEGRQVSQRLARSGALCCCALALLKSSTKCPANISKIDTSDFRKFDYIFAMDRNNLRDLQRKKPHGGKAKLIMFGEFGGGERVEEINDPYYGGKEDFEVAYEQCVRCSKNFLKETFPDVEA